ncbi:MAG: DEAD/DEAH box helicase [Gammaproteobacteria bacterium]|nr:MAG: DEAD/DEAH box helicase [Gammaproteobacteria bacterium]
MNLRPWQSAALEQALKWLIQDRVDRHFLINAAPGSGKTLVSCAIANQLIQSHEIERVIVIAPRAEVVNQWSDEYRSVTTRHMTKVTASDGEIAALNLDICATWAAIQGLLPELQAVCRVNKTLVICDEHHHAAVEAAWGTSADSAFSSAKFVLVLTGTPIRSDSEKTIWLAYDDAGSIEHPAAGTYTLTYGEAVDLGYCRPVTFHRHEGKFTVDLEDGDSVTVSGNSPVELPKELKRIPGLQTALSFYRLARTPQYEHDNVTPLRDGYQATMIEYAKNKLSELRYRMPNAGGLVIAPSIDVAKYMAALIELIESEKPLIVHSQMPNPELKIKAFKNTDKRWLVSVAMVSEGVDIQRLRVLIYLPNALTELAFRQAIGRVVRTQGYDDDTRAYVIMPSFETFEQYARRVEEEMSPSTRMENVQLRHKRCPICNTESPLKSDICPNCEHSFPVASPSKKSCLECGAINMTGATSCHTCGYDFGHNFKLTLDEALRIGAIVRGMDIDEEEVRLAEELAPRLRNKILKSGDQKLIKLLKILPEESWGRLKILMEQSKNSN